MNGCGLLLILGSDFPYRDWYNSDARIIRIDRRASAIGHRNGTLYPVHSDVKPAVDYFLDHTKDKSDSHHFESTMKAKSEWDIFLEKQDNPSRSKDVIHPQMLARAISEMADDNAIFTCDTGEVTVWAARHLYLRKDQRITASFSLASMAYAMPAAIGAQLTYPGRQVISLSGDGGFNMLMGDFLTAVKYKLPVKVIIFNNGKLGLIKMEQEVEGYPEFETELQNPDYKRLAEAMGGTGFTIEDPAKLKPVLEKAFSVEGPVIVDARIYPDELTLPPSITAKQAFGFGLSKVKELFE
jgi:pyruvate dehydrogenase (quinone)